MADKASKTSKTSEPEPAGFAPKAVHIGGESLVDRLLPHVKKIALGAILLTLVLSVYYFVRWMGDRKEIANTEKLTEVVDVAELPVRPPGIPEDTKNPSYASEKDRAAKVLDTISSKESTLQGHAFKGAMLMDMGRTDEAIAEYTLGIAEPGTEGLMSREGLGLAQEAKALAEKDPAAKQKGFEEALATFKTMQPDANGARAAYAYYHQGRMLQLLNKNAEAKAAYLKAKELGKGTDLVPEDGRSPPLIENRLAQLGAS